MMAVKSNVGSQDWFYHAPSEKKPSGNHHISVISQIPDFLPSNDSDLGNDQQQFCRKWIRDGDSDYVKLAKQGGRHDLFRYREHKAPAGGPKPYPRVDWYDHCNSDEQSTINTGIYQAPEWFTHQEHVQSEGSKEKQQRTILGFDDMSIWKRDEENGGRLPELSNKIKARKAKSVGCKNVEVKLPKIMPRGGRKKSIDKGEITDLLAFTYQEDFLRQTNERNLDDRRKKQEAHKERKEKFAQDREKYRRHHQVGDESNGKPLFKLSKYENVSSRIDSHRQ